MIAIDTRAAMRELSRGLRGLARDQIPFATAQALTTVARKVAEGETEQMAATFTKEVPFTKKAMGVIPARKTTLTARVFMKDRQAEYIDPYAFGGSQVLFSKKAILTPTDNVALNAYHNLTRGKLQSLKGRPDIFIGPVKVKSGKVLNGVWQRATMKRARGGRRGVARGAVARGPLKLLILFTDPKTVTKHLPYAERAAKVVAKELPVAWASAIERAMATAK